MGRVDPRALSAVVIVVLLVAAIAVWGWWSSRWPPVKNIKKLNPPAKPVNDPKQIQQINDDAEEARRLQRQGKPKEADAKWAGVEKRIAALGAPDELAPLRQEVDANRKELKPFLGKGANLKTEKSWREEQIPAANRPKEIEKEQILRYYPVGRTVRSGGEFVIEGRGSSRDWVFKRDAYFVVVILGAAETKVLKNDGRTVQFEVAFKEVSRNLLASDESLELTEPDSPLLVVFWRPLEEEVLNGIPAYRILKKVAEWVKVADPRLHRTLTWLQPRLRRNGVELTPNDTIQTMAGIDRLSGTRVELTYVDGVGVTTVKALDGIKLPEEDLETLRSNSGPLLDYFIFPAARKNVGDSWKVRAQDVANLIRLSYRYDVTGELTLERGKDEPGGQAILNVVAGDVSCIGRGEDAEERVDLAVEPGSYVKYSLKQLLATEAKTRFRLKSHYRSLDQFLFRATDVRDVRIEADYHAQLEK